MSKRKKYKDKLKQASAKAKRFLKHVSQNKATTIFTLSVLILSVGLTLGLILDQFALFLGLSVALDVVIFLINQHKDNI